MPSANAVKPRGSCSGSRATSSAPRDNCPGSGENTAGERASFPLIRLTCSGMRESSPEGRTTSSQPRDHPAEAVAESAGARESISGAREGISPPRGDSATRWDGRSATRRLCGGSELFRPELALFRPEDSKVSGRTGTSFKGGSGGFIMVTWIGKKDGMHMPEENFWRKGRTSASLFLLRFPAGNAGLNGDGFSESRLTKAPAEDTRDPSRRSVSDGMPEKRRAYN
ncbi:hypothetical protein EDC14_101360 [Hydrogenispora ethanolica]|uniref:Uncharacterized protein n=1 Tax=Hydrogenispora ethanolica TaxID=1082276 RepID=A0A4R1RR72_HYDET|nr:hypothetical protein EDC14_101360 [Hydrogenispora ethanolica]